MIAVIPAAGMATRLRPLTEHTPKCLLPVEGTPLLGRALNAVIGADINEVVIVTGFLGDQITEYVKKHFPSLKVHWVNNGQYASTNNIYSLYLSRPWCEGREMLLLDSDILFDARIIGKLKNAGYPDTLALSRHKCGEEEVKVALDDNHLVKKISKEVDTKLAAGESVGIEIMSTGYSAALFPELEKMIEGEGLKNVFYEMAFQRLIERGHTFKAVDIAPLNAVEIDTVEDYLAIKDCSGINQIG